VKLFIHEYSGHAFGVQLARELARQGHTVTHAYSAAIESPRGAVHKQPDDPADFTIVPVGVSGSLNKYDFLHRVIEERRYGALLADAILAAGPEAVILGTTPNDVLDVLRQRLPKSLRLIWWLQDIYSVGIRSVLNRKLPFAGDVVGALYRDKERRFAARADHIVSITPDFIPFLQRLGVPPVKVTVIENWGSAQEIVPCPVENRWKKDHGFSGKRLVLYSGTLGLKHNPAILADVAERFQQQGRDDLLVVVVTQGLGAEFLQTERDKRALRNLVVLPWQPYERLAEMLSSAEVLTAIIEPDAGLFSVPSKILSCFCVGRPVMAAIPAENLAARMIERAKAGIVVAPGDGQSFIAMLDKMLADPALRAELGANGRSYAESAFDIEKIASRFLALARG
jgi:glycosyltransferase involved in cell wall biosynthesis